MTSYSLLEEVWDKPLVENQDLLVQQRHSYGNLNLDAQDALPSAQRYSQQSQQEYTLPQPVPIRSDQTPIYAANQKQSLANRQPRSVQHTEKVSLTPAQAGNSGYLDRIAALEDQIHNLERSLQASKSSLVGGLLSDNDLLMYIATGVLVIFAMDNVAKMSRR